MMRTPGLRVVVGAHSERFGYRIGRWTQKAATERGIPFGPIQKQDEFELANGSTWLSRGVGAAVSGLPADLLVVDDPYGTAEDARSEVYRQKVADWYEEDLLGRLQSGGAVILVHTRWHPDDLIGRRLTQEPDQWTYLKLPAIAEEPDGWRQPGDALCPQRFSREDLEAKRAAMRDPAAWESLYQCNPLPRGGTFIRREWLMVVEPAECPWLQTGAAVPERVRYWDLAGTTTETACYTAGVLLARHSGVFYVEDVVRGRWVPSERNAEIVKTAKMDAKRPGFRKTYFEQEPGSAGIDAAQRLGQQLANLPCEADRVTGDKDTRMEPFADQCRLGNVRVVNRSWAPEFITEVSSVPQSRYRDQCLPAGVPIWCRHGSIPIESVTAGDEVMTRQGWREVLGAGMTSSDANTVAIEYDFGGVLLCTMGHPVYVLGRGFVDAAHLREGDEGLAWPTSMWSSGTERSGDGIQTQSNETVAGIIRVICKANKHPYTGQSGNMLTAPFRRGARFIIGTAIRSTMNWTTSNVLPCLSTAGVRGKPAHSPLPRHLPISAGYGGGQPNGIRRRPGAHGTLRMANGSWPTGPLGITPVRSAAVIFRQSSRLPDSVPDHVGIGDERTDQPSTPSSADSATLNSWLFKVGSDFVRTAVVAVRGGPRGVPVYNLKVDDAPEFFAGGILVHNCDSVGGAFNKLTAPQPAWRVISRSV